MKETAASGSAEGTSDTCRTAGEPADSRNDNVDSQTQKRRRISEHSPAAQLLKEQAEAAAIWHQQRYGVPHSMHHTVPLAGAMHGPAGAMPPWAQPGMPVGHGQVIPPGMAHGWCVVPASAQGSGIAGIPADARMATAPMGVYDPAVAGAMGPLGTTRLQHPPAFHGQQLTKEQHLHLLHRHQMEQMQQHARATQQPFPQGSEGEVAPQLQANNSANRHAHHPKSPHPRHPPPTAPGFQPKEPEASQSLQLQAAIAVKAEGRFVDQDQQAHRQNVMSMFVNKKVAKSKSSKDLNEPGKKVAKLKGLRDIDEQEWRRCIQKACNVVFHRLEINGNHLKRDNILARIEQFGIGDFNETPDKQLAACYPCFLVKRENMASKSPFQVQVSGARILAQKIIYASFRKLRAAGMGTWQVRQRCLHPDGTWWCFEPTHLEKCARDHVTSAVTKHQLPFVADALYVARNRHSRHAVPVSSGHNPARPSEQQQHLVQHAAQQHAMVPGKQQHAEPAARVQSQHRTAAEQSNGDDRANHDDRNDRNDASVADNRIDGQLGRRTDAAAESAALDDPPAETVNVTAVVDPNNLKFAPPPSPAAASIPRLMPAANLVPQKAGAQRPTSINSLFKELMLPVEEYAAYCNAAGIDSIEDFLLFSQPELLIQGFRLGHIKRIFLKLRGPGTFQDV